MMRFQAARLDHRRRKVTRDHEDTANVQPDNLGTKGLSGIHIWAAEDRALLLTFDVPGPSSIGHAQIATLELTYVDMATKEAAGGLDASAVNLVPGEEDCGQGSPTRSS